MIIDNVPPLMHWEGDRLLATSTDPWSIADALASKPTVCTVQLWIWDQLPKTLLDTVREKRINRYGSGLCLIPGPVHLARKVTRDRTWDQDRASGASEKKRKLQASSIKHQALDRWSRT